MTRRRRLIAGIALGATGAALAATRASADRRAAASFYEQGGPPGPPRQLGAAYGGPAILYHEVTAFGAIHAAALDAVAAALPTSDLHPVRLPDGRAAVYVGAFRHAGITASGVEGLAALPYGEVMITAFVTTRPAPALLPLLLPPVTRLAAGGFVLQLPVTSQVARDAGRQVYGFPKFVADMAFDERIVERRVELSEGGRRIMSLAVEPGGRPSIDRSPMVLYSVLDGRLVETSIACYGVLQRRMGKRTGSLELGDHPVADALRSLGIDVRPFATMSWVAEHLAMPEGRPIGDASAYPGFAGEERELGRYIVRYPGAGPIDVYAPFAPTAGPAGFPRAIVAVATAGKEGAAAATTT